MLIDPLFGLFPLPVPDDLLLLLLDEDAEVDRVVDEEGVDDMPPVLISSEASSVISSSSCESLSIVFLLADIRDDEDDVLPRVFFDCWLSFLDLVAIRILLLFDYEYCFP
jgi:hypothetical protein